MASNLNIPTQYSMEKECRKAFDKNRLTKLFTEIANAHQILGDGSAIAFDSNEAIA